jgi:predicted negative regulator of RcsB-dependent stress response
MPSDIQTTNMWLAVTAIAVAIQTLFLIVAAYFGWRLYRQAHVTLHDLESRYVAPAQDRLMAVMDDVQDITARARRIDDHVRTRLADFGGAADVAKAAVVSRAWPLIGIARAVDAGVRALGRRAPRDERAEPRPTPGRRVVAS